MLLAIGGTLLQHGIVDYKWNANALVRGTGIGIPLGLFFLFLVTATLWNVEGGGTVQAPFVGSPQAIGQSLFTDYLLPFELLSIVLLVALLGAAMIARHEPNREERLREPVPAVPFGQERGGRVEVLVGEVADLEGGHEAEDRCTTRGRTAAQCSIR